MLRKRLSIEGIEVEVSQGEDKPLLILTRMATRDAGAWDGVWNKLAERFIVANFDLSLPDRSHVDEMGNVFRAFARRCATVSAGLGFDGFHVFGWVGGTHVALRCAVDFPDLVKSVTVLGPFHPLPDMRVIDRQLDFRRVMLEQPDRELYAFYWYMTMFSPPFIAANFNEIEEMAQRRALKDNLLRLDADAIMQWDRGLYRQWISDEEYRSIKAPVLLVGIDANINNAGPTIEMARILRAKIPTSRLEEMLDARALVLLEAPERFLAAADPFFEEVTHQMIAL